MIWLFYYYYVKIIRTKAKELFRVEYYNISRSATKIA